ncbi:hypothetical protein N7507_001094 [Penicillium longicatenatum]|nr:hypothetical protein N7507_001094 [Penicillium longicatenatum]
MPALSTSVGLIQFVGIGGHGVSAIASILHELGNTIQGCDAKESNNTERLRAAGVTVFIGHDKADNIEVEAARDKGIPVIHRAEMLAELMRHKKAIAVGGSHGKSTTTSMIAEVLESGGLMPSVVTGAVMNLYRSNSHLGAGDWVVAEADESDGSFLMLPHLVTIVTNIDSDHIIHWKDETKTREAFVQFVRNGPFHGLGILCIDDPGVRQIMLLLQDRNIVTYVVSEDADFRAVNITYSSNGCSFNVSIHDQENDFQYTIGPIHVNALGLASVQNSLAAITIASELGIGQDFYQ